MRVLLTRKGMSAGSWPALRLSSIGPCPRCPTGSPLPMLLHQTGSATDTILRHYPMICLFHAPCQAQVTPGVHSHCRAEAVGSPRSGGASMSDRQVPEGGDLRTWQADAGPGHPSAAGTKPRRRALDPPAWFKNRPSRVTRDGWQVRLPTSETWQPDGATRAGRYLALNQADPRICPRRVSCSQCSTYERKHLEQLGEWCPGTRAAEPVRSPTSGCQIAKSLKLAL